MSASRTITDGEGDAFTIARFPDGFYLTVELGRRNESCTAGPFSKEQVQAIAQAISD